MLDRSLLWVENCCPINSRSARILSTLGDAGWKIAVCTWDRSLEGQVHESLFTHRFHTPIGYQRPFKKTLALNAYRSHVRRVFQEFKPSLVGCSNWDMAALCVSLRPGVPVWYDVVDLPEGGRLIEAIASWIEYGSLKRIKGITFASPFFFEFYSKFEGATLTLENLPVHSADVRTTTHVESERALRVGFVGNVRYRDSLTKAITAVTSFDLPFAVYGDGPVLNDVKSLFRSSELVQFHGRYAYEDLSEILSGLDLLWAAYPSDTRNVKYAVSNKFYESVAFGIPAAFSMGTRLAEYVAEKGIGLVVDDRTSESIASGIRSVLEQPAILASMRRRLVDFRNSPGRRLHWDTQAEDLSHWVENLIVSK